MKACSTEVGGKGVVMAEGLCFGSLGRFAMEGGKVKLGCEWSTTRVWEAAEEAEEMEEEPETTTTRGLGHRSSNSSSPSSSSTSLLPSSTAVKLLRGCDWEEGGDEDLLGGLAVQVAQSMLVDEGISDRGVPWALECPKSAWPSAKKSSLPTSPQSTLAAGGNWNLSPLSSSLSSGGLSSGVSSPPTPVAASGADPNPIPASDDGDALDALYAELLRLKMEDQIKAAAASRYQQQQRQLHLQRLHHQQQLLLNMKFDADTSPSRKAVGTGLYLAPTQPTGSSSTTSASRPSRQEEQHLSAVNQSRSRRQQTVGTGFWGGQAKQRGGGNCSNGNNSGNGVQYPYNYHHHHQSTQNGSGMRAVFLSGRSTRESSGTGVFLPRRMGSAHDSKRKPACSTVLLPSRIVQALNLNIEDTLACPPAVAAPPPPSQSNASTGILCKEQAPVWRWGSLPTSEAAGMLSPTSGCHHFYQSSKRPSSATEEERKISLQEVAPEISLPTEWTY